MRSLGYCGTVRVNMSGLRGVKTGSGPRNVIPRKLSDAQVEAIRYHYAGVSHAEVGRLFGVTGWLVGRIRRGEKHKRRVKDSAGQVAYHAPPVELIERMDLDVWFIRRAKALLRGYAAATEKWEKEGRFEEPRPEEWQAGDEFGGDASSSTVRRAARIAASARRYLEEQAGKAPPRPRKNQGDPNVRAGKPDVPGLLFDPKR